jgi:hypothetical protein
MEYNRNNHPDENTLELYVLGAAEISESRGEIEAHLAGCEGCRALHDEMKTIYADVDALAEERADAEPDALTVRDRIVPFAGGRGHPVGAETRQPLPVRVVAALYRHPVRTSVGVLAILAMLVGVNFKNKIWKDTNPVGGKGLNDSLKVFNSEGEFLWGTWIGYRYDLNFIPDWFRVDNWIVARDVDHDGRNEVFCCICLRPDSTEQTYMASWSFDGEPRWQYEFHRDMAFGGKPLRDDYRSLGMVVDRYDPGAGDDIMLVVEHRLAPVRAVVRVDALTGEERGVFWNYGTIIEFAARDMDGDGRKDFHFSGYNEEYQSSFLGVLDTRFVSGAGPAGKGEFPDSVGPGTEKYYLLFPHPDIEEGLPPKSQETGLFKFLSDDTLKIVIHTKVNDRAYLPIEYYFNAEMRCVRVSTSPEFISYHREQERKGLVKGKYDASYLEDLRTQIRYWDGEKFVHEPVMNGKYPGPGDASANP